MINGKPAVEAQMRLFPASSGGLLNPMPTGTRSLLLAFALPERDGEDVKFGAVLEVVDGAELVPGTDAVPVTVRFWADEAVVYATPGTTFTLWYGRPVGKGVVIKEADDVHI